MPETNILLILADATTTAMLQKAVFTPAGYEAMLATNLESAEALLRAQMPDVVVIGHEFGGLNGLELGAQLLQRHAGLSLILLVNKRTDDVLLQALRIGFVDCLFTPVRIHEITKAVQGALERRKAMSEWAQVEAKRSSKSLQRQYNSLQTLEQVGRSVTSLLNLDAVLEAVVDAAVELTGAEEGSLLLLDEATGELYMRAARNFQDEFVRQFRLPMRDSLAGQVIRTGEPMTINDTTPRKIKTAYLVHTLIYVPVQLHGRVFGVLGVDNRQGGAPFLEEYTSLVAALADYAAVAIENARAYARIDLERSKLETILTQIEDGVLVADHDNRVILVNHTLRDAFGLGEASLVGRPVRDVIPYSDLVEICEEKSNRSTRSEITLEDGRVFNAQITPIPEVGLAVTMQDITHLKELDRIKSDFVSTVSHDLRSPLTAILGYVELIQRMGPLTEQQREFIRRVQSSVNNITALINDLLDLGRIEAGFDARMEVVLLPAIVEYTLESLEPRIQEREQRLALDIRPDLPPILGNPVRLRQMFSNLLSNACKFTQVGGQIQVMLRAEQDQVIVEIHDDGPGIPPGDQPYIFDKFYRGSNVPYDVPGTGLGLAIVKSIVESHRGRIWVTSATGDGSTFTVVFPIVDQDL